MNMSNKEETTFQWPERRKQYFKDITHNNFLSKVKKPHTCQET